MKKIVLKGIKTAMVVLPSGVKRKLRKVLIPYRNILLPDATYIVFFPTFYCNYQCPYCIINTKAHYSSMFPKKTEHSWKEWTKAFEQFQPSLVSIAGGEPFVYKDFQQLLTNFPSKHLIQGVATNLSFSSDLISKIPRNKVFNITASFHPHMADLKSFSDKVKKIKSSGFPINVNLVAYPELIERIPEIQKHFKRLGVEFTVEPYIDPQSQYTSEEKETVRKHASKDRKLGYQLNDSDLKLCRAGSKYFVVLPNGDVYACHSGLYHLTSPIHNRNFSKEQFYLGNLFEGTFRPKKQEMSCRIPCSESCDYLLAGAKVSANKKED